jgi:hypothetical protein
MPDHSNPSEAARIDRAFSFHPATEETGPKHDAVREECKHLALWIERNIPPSRERSIALTHVQEAMWACNAAIAIDAAEQSEIAKNFDQAMKNV